MALTMNRRQNKPDKYWNKNHATNIVVVNFSRSSFMVREKNIKAE
jgi:hypothetical protein